MNQNVCNQIILNLIDLFEVGYHHEFLFQLKKYSIDINTVKDPDFQTNLYEKAANMWQCEFLFENGLIPNDENGGVLFHCSDETLKFLLNKGVNPIPAINKIKSRLDVEKFYKQRWWLKTRLEMLERHVEYIKRILHTSMQDNLHTNVRNELIKYYLS